MKPKAENPGDSLEKTLLELKKGRLCPCILIHGEDDFSVTDALHKVIEALIPVADRDLNLFMLDGDEIDAGSLCETLLTSPLFPGRKVVVVRQAPFFHSRQTAADIIQKVRGHLEKDPLRAGRDFMTFLAVAGWALEDLRDDGWRKIPDDEWFRLVEGEPGQQREQWLPKVIGLCVERGLTGKKSVDEGERLVETLVSGLPEGHVLILTAAAVDKRKRLYKAISDIGKIITFAQVKGDIRQRAQLMAASQSLLSAAGKSLTDRAWTVLGEKTGFDLRNSLSALEKLIVHAGDRSVIDDKDVVALIGKTKEDTVFNLTAALAEKNVAASLKILDELMVRGTQPLMILAMLIRELRLLLQAKAFLMTETLGEYDVKMDYNAFQARIYPRLKDLGTRPGGGGQALDLAAQHPYGVFLVFKNAARFSYAALVGHLERLAAADLQMKTTGRNPRWLLERFILSLCG